MENIIGRPLIEKRKKETHISIRKDNILKDIEGGKKKKEKKINEILFLCLICLLVIIWLIYICSKKDIFLSYLENEKEYGIIIDAGSNGTRIHLFEWKRKEYKVINMNEENKLTKVKEIFNANIKKSISTISYNEIKDILIYLINKVIDHLIKKKIYIYNKKKWKTYPFYFEATGGMRNLKQEERNLRMKYIKNILSNDNYNPFNFLNEYARILSGEEEGIYGWLAVNNLLNSIFYKPNNTYGAIDLGGSSTQITFYPIDDNILENYNSLLLNNKLIRLYSHSFIGYGWIDALFRVNIYLCLGIIKKLSTRNIKKISQHEDYNDNYINDYFYKNLPNYNSYFFSSTIKINNNNKENNNHHNNDHINDNIKKLNYTYNYYKQKYLYTNPKKVYYIKDNINNSNKSYQNIWDILLQEIIKYINYSQKDYPIGYSKDTYDYTYNIYDDQPYDIENFIKTIKDFKRNSEEDTIMVVQNPCLPYPYEMKIILPTYNLITSQFVIPKKVNGNNIGKIYDIKNNDNNYNHKDNINDMYEFNGSEGYDNFISNGVLRLNIINNNMSLMDNIYEDFKNKGYLNNVLKKMNDNKMNDNLKNDNMKDDMIKYLFEKIINEKIKELYINISVKIIGSNNFKQCLEYTKNLFYEQPCFLSSCSFNGIYQPNLENNQFVLHGQFKKVITYLGFKKYLQLNKMKKHIHKICNMNLYELTKNNMSNKILDNQITTFCWKSIWSYSLLFYGFKFNENSKLLIINDDINISYHSPGTSHTWKQYCNSKQNDKK